MPECVKKINASAAESAICVDSAQIDVQTNGVHPRTIQRDVEALARADEAGCS